MIALAATLKAKVCTSLSSRYAMSAVPLLRQMYHLDSAAGCSGPVAAAANASSAFPMSASKSLAAPVAVFNPSGTVHFLGHGYIPRHSSQGLLTLARAPPFPRFDVLIL